jgi:Motility quorum-sensing regulator, toxin of MqsA
VAYYDLNDIRYLVKEDAWDYATNGCRRDVESLGLTRAQVASLLLALDKEKDFRKEFGTASTDFGDVLADDYVIWFDEDSLARCRPYLGTCFYVKVAIHSEKDGDACLVISLHLDSRP